jgi:hypothetical protein
VFKLESPGQGGTEDDEGFQALANPNQDGLSVQGIFLQLPKGSGSIEEDELVYISRDVDGNMVFLDVVTGAERSLEYLTDKKVKVTIDDDVPDFLQAKLLAGDSITITKEGTGADEKLRIAAAIAQVFSTDYDTSTVFASTGSFTEQDAGMSVEAPVDGDYIVIYDSEVRVTNSNGEMAISLSTPNTLTEKAGTERITGGSNRKVAVSQEPYIGLSSGDIITALFRKESGPGSAEIYNRSMYLQRIG